MIRVNFLEQQNSIIAYIKEHYKDFTGSLAEPNEYITDFLDLDKYKSNFTMFFNFGGYTFDWKTNESELQETELFIYLVLRNAPSKTLRDNMLEYTTAFYQMFDEGDQCFKGVIDYGKITEINFYEWAEANKGIKISEILLTLRNEI
jgi:hypothetical protein